MNMRKGFTAISVALATLVFGNLQNCLCEPANVNDLNIADAKDEKRALSIGKMSRDTPLLVAAYDGDAEKVDRLLKAGANPNLDGDYGNALSSALTGLSEGYWRDHARNARYLKVVKSLVTAGVNVDEENGGGSGRSIKDMVLQNKNSEYMQQLREAIGMAKADGKTGGLTSEQITKILSGSRLANISALTPLIKSDDSAVRSRSLDLILELATDMRSEGPLNFMLVYIEGSGRPLALLGQEVFTPQLTAAVIEALEDPKTKVRIKALQTLRALASADSEVLKAVTNKLTTDPDGGVKIAAAGTLASFAASQKPDMTPRVVKTLESALAREKNAQAKLGIAMVLNYERSIKNKSQASRASTASPPRVLAMVFGRAMGFQNSDIKETTSIPDYHDGHQQAGYRLCMVLDSRDKAPRVKLKLQMPAKRNDWSFGHNPFVPGFDSTWKSKGAVEVSADGRTGTYTDSFTQQTYGNFGLYGATWPTDEETVPGKYRLEVYFDDKLEKAYDFDLFEKKAK
jgi:HEAT repeats